jgi:hypothetical protein
VYYFHGFDAATYLTSPDNNYYFYYSGNHPTPPGGIYRGHADDPAGTNFVDAGGTITTVVEDKIRVPSTAWDGSQMLLFLKDLGSGGTGRQTYRYTSSDGKSWSLDGGIYTINSGYLNNHAGNHEMDTSGSTWYSWTNISTSNGVPTAVHKSTDNGATWTTTGYSPRLIDDSGLVVRRPVGDTFTYNGERWAVCLMWPPEQGSGLSMSGAKLVQMPISDNRRRYKGPPEVIFDPANDGTMDGTGDLQSAVVRVFGSTAHVWLTVTDTDVYHASSQL